MYVLDIVNLTNAFMLFVYLDIFQCGSTLSLHYTDAFINDDGCCFNESNSTETSCHVRVPGLDTSAVEKQNISLQLETTNHNLVCDQGLLPVIVDILGRRECILQYIIL